MKISFLFLTFIFLLFNIAYADGFAPQTTPTTFKESALLQEYVRTISRYPTESIWLNERLQKTIEYYKRVHILKTIYKTNFIIDCIPFAEQPALIDRQQLAQSLIPSMRVLTQNNIFHLDKMGEQFAFNTAKECPFGAVAMLRPTQAMLTTRAANQKIAPPKHQQDFTLLHSGYTWQQGVNPTGETIYIPTQASQAYFKGPQNQFVTPLFAEDHSLNQFWLTRDVKQPHENLTFSVEFGIIASAYFTPLPSTSIFVFASIDNYGPNSCYDLECPNFIQAPGTPPLGAPITNKNADYIFQVKHVTQAGFQPGYYLTLVTHNPAATILLGFYPDSLYLPSHRPQFFSAGAEVFSHEPGDGTLMYGNYANPYAGYNGPKQIGLFTRNGNFFPYSTSYGPPPYGVIWNLGH